MLGFSQDIFKLILILDGPELEVGALVSGGVGSIVEAVAQINLQFAHHDNIRFLNQDIL